ncbi:MAG TPA: DUF2383 domain-containing protein [Candidatus Omnitrophota bacterium]|nr:DUF2383 domain-containing protein [Candidatus Omnitrophota bacterium]
MPDAQETLNHLVQIDLDAIRAYDQAIRSCADPSATGMLSGFREDHRRHVDDLSAAIRAQGGEPPERASFSGFAIAGFTAVSASAGLVGTLTVMESNEVVTNDAYERALAADLPADTRQLVERNRADEQRHLNAIRARLESLPGGEMMSRAAAIHGTATSAWMNTLRHNLPAALLLGAGAAWMLGGLLSRQRAESRRPEMDTGARSATRH